MNEKAIVECPNCHKRFSVLRSNLGVRARCKGCGNSFRLEEWIDDEPDIVGISEAASEHYSHAPPPLPLVPATASTNAVSWAERIKQSRTFQVAGIAFMVLLLLGLGWLKFQQKQDRRDRLAKAVDETFIKPADPPPAARAVETAPPAPAARTIATPPRMSTVPRDGYVESTATVSQRHARRTTVRLLLPPGEHTPAALPCVFVCPAGSNLLMGVRFSDDEHEDYLPLLQQGIAVCLYSLDGSVRDNAHDMEMVAGMIAYRESDGGLKNLADAIDTVLASHPQIDPRRLAAAGHSSAGTIAMIAAAREPRIIAAAALAPALDLPNRFKDAIDSFDAEMTRFVYASSPSHVEKFNGPIFIYQCRDDDNVPVAEAEAFSATHGAKVTVQIARRGGHDGALHDGAAPAFAFLAKTLNANPIASEITGQASPPPRPAPGGGVEVKPPAAPPIAEAADSAKPGPSDAPASDAQAEPLDGRQPRDSAFTGWTAVLGSVQLTTKARPEGFVFRRMTPAVEIVRPSETGIAPRLRIYIFRKTTPQVKGSRNPKPHPEIGIIHVDGVQKIVHLHRPENTKEVPFLLPQGTAIRTEGEDLDFGRPTREVLYGCQLPEAFVAMHLIAGPNDEEGMKALEELVKTFELREIPKHRSP